MNKTYITIVLAVVALSGMYTILSQSESNNIRKESQPKNVFESKNTSSDDVEDVLYEVSATTLDNENITTIVEESYEENRAYKFNSGNTQDESNTQRIYTYVSPKLLQNLHENLTLEFDIPQTATTYTTTIESVKQKSNEVSIFKGLIKQGNLGGSVTIVRGEKLSFATVSTEDGVFSIEIDNITGETVIESESSLSQDLHEDDAVYVHEEELL